MRPLPVLWPALPGPQGLRCNDFCRGLWRSVGSAFARTSRDLTSSHGLLSIAAMKGIIIARGLFFPHTSFFFQISNLNEKEYEADSEKAEYNGTRQGYSGAA